MEWTENLSVGVEQIDNQHRELIDRINRFYLSMKKGDKKEEILKMLRFMDEYVKIHFADEEKLQIKYNYPGYQAQRAAHQKFIKDIADIEKDIRENGITVASGLVVGSTLSNWLINHISKMDRELGKFLKGKV